MSTNLQSQSKPLQFVILDNKNILKVVPQPVVENPKIATPLPKISPKLLLPLPQVQHPVSQKTHKVVKVLPSESSSSIKVLPSGLPTPIRVLPSESPSPIKVLPSELPSPKRALPSESPSQTSHAEVTKQIPIQMLFYNGNLVQVLPGKQQSLEPTNKTGSLPTNLQQTKSCSLPSNVQVRKSGKEVFLSKKDFEASLVPAPSVKKVKEDGKKSSESMIKTNEKITKNGDLFCTFKNVKHMKFLKEQQAKKYRLKRDKNK